MSPRLAFAGFVALASVLGQVTGCYDVPSPACGFACGPGDACPDGYRCAGDRYCHRNDAPADLACGQPDAALPADAADGAGSDSTSPTRPATAPRGSS